MADPLNPDQPSLMRTLYEQHSQLDQLQQLGYSPQAINSLQNLNESRVSRGVDPYTLQSEAVRRGLQAAHSEAPVTQEPERGGNLWDIPGNALKDMKSMGSMLSPLTFARGMWNQAKGLTQIPEAISESADMADGNPLEFIGNLADQPGFQLIPGSMIATEMLGTEGDGLSGLAQNPLFAFMDAYPYAGVAARGSKVGKAVKGQRDDVYKAQLEQIKALLPEEVLVPPRQPKRVGVSTVLNKKLDVEGNLVPTGLGRLVAEAGQRFGDNPVGGMFRATFGVDSRDVMQMLTSIEENMRVGGRQLTEFDQALLKEYEFGIVEMREFSDKLGWDQEQRARMAEIVSTKTAGGPDWTKLTPDEATYLQKYEDAQMRLTDLTVGKEFETGGIRYADLFDKQEIITFQQGKKLDMHRGRTDAGLALGAVRDDLVELRLTPEQILETHARISDDVLRGVASKKRGRFSELKLERDLTTLYALQVRGFDVTEAVRAVRDGEQVDFGALQQVSPGVDAVLGKAQLNARNNFLKNKNRKFTTKNGLKWEQQFLKVQARLVPQRFKYLVDQKKKELMKGAIKEQYSHDPVLMKKHLADAEDGIYSRALDKENIEALSREADEGWVALRDAGLDPSYVHAVSPEAAMRVTSPTVNVLRKAAVTSHKATMDFAPMHKDLGISLAHQALEMLEFRGRESARGWLIERMGKSYDEIMDELLPIAQEMARKQKGRSVQEILDHLAKARYRPFTEEMFPSLKFSSKTAPDMYLPKHVQKLLEHVDSQPLSGIERALDPATRVFRTSVLALSPRWHINNILGGWVMLTAQTGDPFAIFKHWNEAKAALNDPLSPVPRTQAGFGQGGGSVSADQSGRAVAKSLAEASIGEQNRWIFKYRAGRTLSRVMDQIEKASAVSFKFNQHVDDMYRATAYLSGHKSAKKAGLSEADAFAKGIAMTRKTMQQWDRMTPMERSMLRSVFPFYGWMSHVMKFVTQYPVDHPFRVSVLANFADAEMKDFDSGLPQQLFNLFGLGSPDQSGEQMFLDPGGVNPFRDLDQYFHLQGFPGQMHPLIGVGLEALGVDTREGAGELYPDMHYDPETGNIVAKPQGFMETLGSAVYSLVPQFEGLSNMLGVGSSFAELNESNPDAARRMMMSSFGLPTAWRMVDLPKERMEAEMNRYEQMRADYNAGLKTGNYAYASRWEENVAYFDQIQALSAEELAPYKIGG